ncbi:MAG: GtrA family protein [Puniceicoccaceae bacterium]
MLTPFRWLKVSPTSWGTFSRFAVVGGSVSIVDIWILYSLIDSCTDPYLARAASHTTAIVVGYFLHRHYTFRDVVALRAFPQSFARHCCAQMTGGLINLAIYAAIVMVAQTLGNRIDASNLIPMVAVWIGGVVGLFANFHFSRRFVFNSR